MVSAQDEYSGAVLNTRSFPLADWQQVPATQTQRWLRQRQTFERWGLPGCLRVDNGVPWGNPGDLPSALALWLIGLGIDLHWNHARHPHENGQIERFNSLIDQWGEPAQCADFQAWQAKLRWLVRVQRERYPAVAGLSRAKPSPRCSACADLIAPHRKTPPGTSHA